MLIDELRLVFVLLYFIHLVLVRLVFCSDSDAHIIGKSANDLLPLFHFWVGRALVKLASSKDELLLVA